MTSASRWGAGSASCRRPIQLALTVALARRPDLLVLDEPLAMLDAVARHDFMASVMEAVAEDGVSVVLSSTSAELERVADYPDRAGPRGQVRWRARSRTCWPGTAC